MASCTQSGKSLVSHCKCCRLLIRFFSACLFTSCRTQIHVAELPFGFLLFSGINCIFVFTPLLFGSYEKPAPSLAPGEVRSKTENTALLIPCYKAAGALPNTIRAALKIFPATSIFVVDNGNTEKGTDASEQVCAEWGVNYLFVPVGSKIG